MSALRGLVLTNEARRNISDILLTTEQRWGRRQRISYRLALSGAMSDLVRYPNLGRSREEIAAEMRSLPVGQHVVFYRVDDQSVIVVRVLHQKMDPTGEIDGI